MKQSRPGSGRARSHRRLAVLAPLVLLSLSAVTPAVAAKGGGVTTSGSCSASPSPVAVGANYTLTGAGLGAYTFVNVLISDSGATTSWNLQADAAGALSLTTQSYWSGTSRVTMQTNARHGFSTIATCSFLVS